MSTAVILQTVMENEAIVFGLFGLACVGFWLWFAYMMRRWSWVPRKTQRKWFCERL